MSDEVKRRFITWVVAGLFGLVAAIGVLAENAPVVGLRTPSSGGVMQVVTSSTVIVLDGAYRGSIGLLDADSCFWIDTNGNGILEVATDVVVTSAGVAASGGTITVWDSGTTLSGRNKVGFASSGTMTVLEVAADGTSGALVTIGLTQEAETSITLAGTGSGGGSGGGGGTSTTIQTRTLLSSQTLSAPASATTFSAVSQDYDWLEITFYGRSVSAVNADVLYMYFNGDTTVSNYKYAEQYGGGTNGGAQGTAPIVGRIPGASSASDAFGHTRIILDPVYNTSDTEKSAQGLNALRSGSNFYVWQCAHFWINATNQAINEIVLKTDGGDNFATNTSVQLWGFKEEAIATQEGQIGFNSPAAVDILESWTAIEDVYSTGVNWTGDGEIAFRCPVPVVLDGTTMTLTSMVVEFSGLDSSDYITSAVLVETGAGSRTEADEYGTSISAGSSQELLSGNVTLQPDKSYHVEFKLEYTSGGGAIHGIRYRGTPE